MLRLLIDAAQNVAVAVVLAAVVLLSYAVSHFSPIVSILATW